MNSILEKLYKEKLTTAEEAVKLICSGDRVYAGTASSGAYALLDALWERRHELEDVTILSSNLNQSTPVFDESIDNPFLFNTYFVGISERKRMKGGSHVTYNSVHLSKIDCWVRDIAKPDVCLFEVSTPDDDGYMYYGPSGVSLNKYLQESAGLTILEVNKKTPHVFGEGNKIHVSEADAIIEADREYEPFTSGEPDDISVKVASHIIREVGDGSTIQLGLGNISLAVGYELKARNDLGIYTEMLAQPMFELIKNGNVSNRHKGFLDGKSVYSFALGSPELYEALDNNSEYYAAPFTFVNDSRNIAKNKNFISINSAMSLDLSGEAAADCLGWKQQSGTGGQLDFVRGAQWSEGGKSIIAMASSFIKNGKRISKIVPFFPPGSAVTTPRSDINYVATEYGCVDLKALTLQDRVRAMISLAHPDFRDELTEQAKKYDML